MVFGAVVAVLLGVGLRAVVTSAAGLTPADLARFEDESGIDLPDAFGEVPFFLMWTRGDGGTYLALAADLDLDGPSHRLLSPRLRVSRLGFAVLIWLVAFGRVAWFPISLFFVVTAGLGLYGAMTARLAAVDRRAWWLLANPAVLIGYVGDSTEPLGLGLLLLAALATTTGTSAAAGTLLGGVRPSLFPATLAGRHPGAAATATGAVAVALFGLGRAVFPTDPAFPFRPPLAGYLTAIPAMAVPDLLVVVVVAVAAGATIVVGVRRHRGGVRWAWILSGVLVLALPDQSIDQATNLLRIAGILPVLWALGGAHHD